MEKRIKEIRVNMVKRLLEVSNMGGICPQISSELESDCYIAAVRIVEQLIGVPFKDLPRGFSREGWGVMTYTSNGVQIWYRFSKWSGDIPCLIMDISIID